MLKQRAERYSLEGDYNCAEAILRAANDEFRLGLDDKALKLMGGYGGGLGCGETCGALCGALAAVSAAPIDARAHATPGFKDVCAGFVTRFREAFGSIDCRDIRERFVREDRRCADTVDIAAELLEEYLGGLLAGKGTV